MVSPIGHRLRGARRCSRRPRVRGGIRAGSRCPGAAARCRGRCCGWDRGVAARHEIELRLRNHGPDGGDQLAVARGASGADVVGDMAEPAAGLQERDRAGAVLDVEHVDQRPQPDRLHRARRLPRGQIARAPRSDRTATLLRLNPLRHPPRAAEADWRRAGPPTSAQRSEISLPRLRFRPEVRAVVRLSFRAEGAAGSMTARCSPSPGSGRRPATNSRRHSMVSQIGRASSGLDRGPYSVVSRRGGRRRNGRPSSRCRSSAPSRRASWPRSRWSGRWRCPRARRRGRQH